MTDVEDILDKWASDLDAGRSVIGDNEPAVKLALMQLDESRQRLRLIEEHLLRQDDHFQNLTRLLTLLVENAARE